MSGGECCEKGASPAGRPCRIIMDPLQDFNACLDNLNLVLPELDRQSFESRFVITSPDLSNEKKLELLAAKHFTTRRQHSILGKYGLTKEANRLHSLFPSLKLNTILEHLKLFQDMPAREEIVLRLMLQSREQHGGDALKNLKRTSPTSSLLENIKVRRLAEMQKMTDDLRHRFPLRSSVDNQIQETLPYPRLKPSTITSMEINPRPEPFSNNPGIVTNGYEVPDIMEHFDMPVMDLSIPVTGNCTITSGSVTNKHPDTVLPQIISLDNEKPKDSQGSDQTEIYPLDLPDIPDNGYSGGMVGSTAIKINEPQEAEGEGTRANENQGGTGSKVEVADLIDNTGSAPAEPVPSTSKENNQDEQKEFDLIAYLHEITQFSKITIRRHCRKYSLATNVKPTPFVLQKMIDDMAIVIDSEDSDVEEYLPAEANLDNAFAIAEEIIAEDNTNSPPGEAEASACSPQTENPPKNNENSEKVTNSSPSKVDVRLVKHLCSMFSDACPRYIEDICRNKSMNDADLNDIITVIISTDNNYPKRPPPTPEPDLPPENQLEILKEFLPDADPDYLRMICDKYEGKPDLLRSFLVEATENRNYPTLKDYQRRQQLSAQQKQYTSEFTVENFIKVIPDPVTFFADPTRNIKLNTNDAHYALIFMRNRFKKLPIRNIQSVFTKSGCNLSKSIAVLEAAMKNPSLVMKSIRKTMEMPNNVENIPLLQELAYYAHKDEIHEHLKQQKEKETTEREEAKNKGLLKTCTCCYDDEILPKDIYRCEKGCEFCKDCIIKGSEVRFGEGKLDFPCLMNCSAAFTLQTLQAVLSPKLFSRIAQKKALEEIKSAGIEELEMCPFCDFATIPAEGYTIFTCMNPECMKESCRMCKEPSHVPLRCDEIEKDQDVKARTFLENKMTEALLRKCYKCGVKFFKEEGCNKMTCSCGAKMCYVCGQPVDSYKHFNGNGGDRFDLCPLYSDTNVLNKENVLKGAEEAKAKLGNVKLKHDPTADLNKHYDERRKMFPQQHLLVGQQPRRLNPEAYQDRMNELLERVLGIMERRAERH